MTEYYLSVPGAARLASLAGLKSDLEQVVDCCDRMIDRYAGPHLKKSPFDIVGFTTHVDFLDWEALSAAACIAYARCFVSGVRQSLDAELLALAEQELRETHDFTINLRNKHIAHSVNSFEENSVTVQIEDTYRSASEIRSVVPRHTRAVGLPFDGPANLRLLAQWWLTKVSDETHIELASVLRIAQAMSLDEIRAHGTLKSSSAEQRNASIAKRRRNP